MATTVTYSRNLTLCACTPPANHPGQMMVQVPNPKLHRACFTFPETRSHIPSSAKAKRPNPICQSFTFHFGPVHPNLRLRVRNVNRMRHTTNRHSTRFRSNQRIWNLEKGSKRMRADAVCLPDRSQVDVRTDHSSIGRETPICGTRSPASSSTDRTVSRDVGPLGVVSTCIVIAPGGITGGSARCCSRCCR